MTDKLEEIKERYRYTNPCGTDDRLMYPVDAQDALQMAVDFDWLISEVERMREENKHLINSQMDALEHYCHQVHGAHSVKTSSD